MPDLSMSTVAVDAGACPGIRCQGHGMLVWCPKACLPRRPGCRPKPRLCGPDSVPRWRSMVRQAPGGLLPQATRQKHRPQRLPKTDGAPRNDYKNHQVVPHAVAVAALAPLAPFQLKTHPCGSLARSPFWDSGCGPSRCLPIHAHCNKAMLPRAPATASGLGNDSHSRFRLGQVRPQHASHLSRTAAKAQSGIAGLAWVKIAVCYDPAGSTPSARCHCVPGPVFGPACLANRAGPMVNVGRRPLARWTRLNF